MLYRKISSRIEEYLKSDSSRILMVEGARQIGKSYIIRHIGQRLFKNFIELNMEEDKLKDRIFAEAKTIEDFYMALSVVAGDRMKDKSSTLVFIDEIQAYEHLLTLVKFLKQDDKFTYIASGSLLGVTLRKTQSVPMGSLEIAPMYPMDFEEFLIANGMGQLAIDNLRQAFLNRTALNEAIHNKMLDFFKKYLIIGGMPKAVQTFVDTKNINKIRSVQREIHELYKADCTKYEEELNKKLKIRRIYDMIPSMLENKKKRMVFKDIEDKKWKRSADYEEEFEYLISAGVVLEDKAVSTPTYPLIQNSSKNLIKLYMNDVGILSGIYYKNNINAIMNDDKSTNLGALYETVVAQELAAHDFKLFYYDNKKKGEIDFLIDDVENLSNIPLEVKSGKDYTIHSALDSFMANPDYNIRKGYVLSNERDIYTNDNVTYIPIYLVMCFHNESEEQTVYLD